MKRGFLSFQIRDQLFSAISRDSIAYRKQYPAIPSNLLINLDALITHCVFLAEAVATLHEYGRASLLFHRSIGKHRFPDASATGRYGRSNPLTQSGAARSARLCIRCGVASKHHHAQPSKARYS
jgi:hypothetical protein